MSLRSDQVVFSYWLQSPQWSAPMGRSVMPPDEDLNPGDMVCFKKRPECLGLVVARTPGEIEYTGLSSLTKENIVRETDGSFRFKHCKATIDFYTILWNTGTLRAAGAHMLHQLRRVAT